MKRMLLALYLLFAFPFSLVLAAPLEVIKFRMPPPDEFSPARLKAELSYMAQAADERTVMRSDMRREGHGFRQDTVENCERMIYAV